MGIQIAVLTGKPEEKKKGGVGIMRQAETEKEEKHPEVSLAELVSSVLAQVGAGVSVETEVEIEITGVVEFADKDGKIGATFDIGNETPGSRAMKLKLKSKVTPK
ncbi:MAG: hypothetical protein HXX08_01405 [Chloroflexi bacterium]|jgi:hypothetical protein|uniref:Uncharacterized protein n=1 Tax=Candidatus Chlorohelix allophototropha TaxID=3003348 RepID=A0A8T7LUF7_9CHLR|nr:hypothetical protein [Chloroflexota bacterium]WJW66406.1 hypothetical protein OZ401_002202 [Chloroflexota bacterium L227-S17]